MKKKHKLHFYIDQKGEHRWRLKAGNGKIVAESGEGYTTYVKVVEAWWRVLRTLGEETITWEFA